MPLNNTTSLAAAGAALLYNLNMKSPMPVQGRHVKPSGAMEKPS